MTGKEFIEELNKHLDCKKEGIQGDCKHCKFARIDGSDKYCLIKQCEAMRDEMGKRMNFNAVS